MSTENMSGAVTTPKQFNFEGMGEGIAKTPSMVETEVTISQETGLMRYYIEAIMCELNTDLSTQPIVEQDLTDYIWWLVQMRVLFTNGVRLPFKLKDEHLCVPAYLFSMLECLGRVEDVHRGFSIRIASPSDAIVKELTSDDYVRRMKRISNILESQFKAIGYQYATVIPCNSKFGEVNFMTFQLIANEIKNEDDKPAPFLATMYSLLGFKQMEAVTMTRIGYGDIIHHRNLIRGVTRYEKS